MDSSGYLIQRGGRLLLLSSDGKRLQRLVSQTLLTPLSGLWAATGIGDRVFVVDGGADGSVYLTGGIRVCIVDVASGRQRILYPDAVIRDHLGRPVDAIEGASTTGMSDWQLIGLRFLPGERVLHITMSHPISGTAVCAIDARTGAAVVAESGTWRRMGSAMFMDENAGVVASVERDAIDVPLVVTMTSTSARLVVGVPVGAVGKFSEVAVSPDGKFVAVVLAGSAVYIIDVTRRSSRKVATGSYTSPQWSQSGKTVLVIKHGVSGQKSALVEINPATLVEKIAIQNVDDYHVVTRKLPDWKIKTTP
ncbi:MAG: hypothetical protein RL169_396 [Armatimonadota bacterium]|jgi:hypothetical protein